MLSSVRCCCAALTLLALGSLDARPDEIELPSSTEFEDAVPLGEALDGRELYDRFLRNRLHSAVQFQRIVSSDPGGSEQTTRFWTRWKDYRRNGDSTGAPREASDVVGKTLVQFTHPFDMRHTAYLMIAYEDEPSQQWMYRSSTREVRRVRLSSVGIMGTDFDYDDVAFETIDDADYRRLPDEEIGGTDVYVVEARPKPEVGSRYSRSLLYLEKEHYVAVRSRMWDAAEVPVKEMNVKRDSIRAFDGVWIATESEMRNLHEGTTSTLFVEKLDANPIIAEQKFSLMRLHMGR
jgi:hypothetical protein